MFVSREQFYDIFYQRKEKLHWSGFWNISEFYEGSVHMESYYYNKSLSC